MATPAGSAIRHGLIGSVPIVGGYEGYKAAKDAGGKVGARTVGAVVGTVGAPIGTALGAYHGYHKGLAKQHQPHFAHGVAHSGPTVGMSKPAGGPKGLAAHADRRPIQKP